MGAGGGGTGSRGGRGELFCLNTTFLLLLPLYRCEGRRGGREGGEGRVASRTRYEMMIV